MKESGYILVAFSKDSWKPFSSEDEAIEFINEQKERYNEFWSITNGTIEFNTPYLESPIGYQIQEYELVVKKLKCLE